MRTRKSTRHTKNDHARQHKNNKDREQITILVTIQYTTIQYKTKTNQILQAWDALLRHESFSKRMYLTYSVCF